MVVRRALTNELIQICRDTIEEPSAQIQILAHQVRKEYESIDFFNRSEKAPWKRHRVRKLYGNWKVIF